MKIRVSVVVSRDIEIRREQFPPEFTNQDILQCEIAFANTAFLEWVGSGAKRIQTTGEIL